MVRESKKELLPTAFVIFGATGDLMQSKLAPTLFELREHGWLPDLFEVIGFARQDLSNEAFQARVAEMIAPRTAAPREAIEQFSKSFVYQQGLFEEKAGYEALARFLGRKDNEWQVCSNKLFYLAVPPQFYDTIFRHLDTSGLTEPCSPEEGWTRVIVEKPFGKDLKTAQELDNTLGKLFREEQIYRIDHYLGKETTQNILAFRFSNSFLQNTLNNQGVERVHAKFLEREGVGERGAFYEGIGALRDVGQNHVLQLLSLFLMENPGSYDGDSVRAKRAEILEALHIPSTKEAAQTTLRAQYRGYRQETNVNSNSQTETYFRLKTSVDTPRWKGVPVYLEGGKGMERDMVEIAVVFRHPTPCLCPPEEGKHYQNILYYHIQPNEGVELAIWAKKPGLVMTLEQKKFSFNYKEAFEEQEFLDAYEKLLLDAIKGDQTLYVSTREIVASWKFIDAILQAWQKNAVPLQEYEKEDVGIRKVPLPADKE